MPRRDKTGPEGKGPMTGRGKGKCKEEDKDLEFSDKKEAMQYLANMTGKKVVVSSIEHGFGLTEDGWDTDDLEEAMEFLIECEEVKYELNNAVRGSYAKIGKTVDDLI